MENSNCFKAFVHKVKNYRSALPWLHKTITTDPDKGKLLKPIVRDDNIADDAVESRIQLNRLCQPEARRSFDGIYERLLINLGPSRPPIILVCSATDGEGATTVALGLALAATQKQTGQVLLIDGNFHKPKICDTFGLTNEVGLGNLINDGIKTGDFIRKTTISKLWVMGSGAIPENSIQALETHNIREIIDNYIMHYPFIVVDGPSINNYSESILYSSQVERIVLVVHAGVTRAPVLAEALSRLPAAVGNKVEIVLNRRSFAIPWSIYKKL